jgi:hypothetical protein
MRRDRAHSGQDCPIYSEIKMENLDFTSNENWQTKTRGSLQQEYQIYLSCADDGNGGDITRNGAPLKTFAEWMDS